MLYGKEEIFELLERENISYKAAFHKPVSSIEEIKDAKISDSEFIAVNLFVTDRKRENYYLIVANSKKKVDLKEVREKIGSKRLSFAASEDLIKYLGLKSGAVSPFGVLNDREKIVELYIDSCFKDKVIGVHPNDNTASVWIQTEDLVKIIERTGCSVEYIDI